MGGEKHMCSHTGSPSQVPPSQQLSNSHQGPPSIDAQWDTDLDVAVAERGQPAEREHWRALYERACSYQESGNWSSAARNFQAASDALGVGTLEEARGYEQPHPYMLKPVLRLASIAEMGIVGPDTLEVHRRLVLLCSRLMTVFAAWEYRDAKQHGRAPQQTVRELDEDKKGLALAEQRLAPNQSFGPHTETSKKDVRDVAEKMLKCFDEARKQGVVLAELQATSSLNG